MNIAPLQKVCTDFIVRHFVHSQGISPKLTEQIKHCEVVYSTGLLKELVARYPTVLTDELLEILCHRNISTLNLQKCSQLTQRGLKSTLERCNQVKSLDLSGCNQLVTEDLVDVLKVCGGLSSLKLDGCSNLTSDILKAIFKLPTENISCENCDQLCRFPLYGKNAMTQSTPYIVSINVSGCRNISNTFVRHLTALHGQTLKSVNISCTQIDCTALIYLSGYGIEKVAEIATESFSNSVYDTALSKLHKERNLLKLCLENLESKKPLEKSASAYLKNMCAYCSQEIGVRDSSQSTISCFVESYEDYDIIDSQVLSMTENEKNLVKTYTDTVKELELEWDILSVDDINLPSKSIECTCTSPKSPERWRSFSFPPFNSHYEEEFCDQTNIVDSNRQFFKPILTKLDITRIDYIDYEVGKKYLEVFLSANSTLEQMHLSWVEMDDVILSMIAKLQPNLQLISLVDCERVTDEGISGLSECCSQLKAIDFKGMPFVWDVSLLRLVGANTQLQYLSLAESSLTDAMLIKVAECHSGSLRHLDLSWCDNVTDKGVVQVMRRCENLVYLDLRQCNVTSQTVIEITKYGHRLNMLGLCGIKGLNDSVCIPLVKALSNLRIIDLSWNSSLTDDSLVKLFHSCQFIQEVTVAGLKRISSKPFLSIISGLVKWQQVRSVIKHRLHLKYFTSSGRLKHMTDLEVSDPAFYIPFRSVHYAPELRKLTLGYCDKVNDIHLAEIVAVCRGTLMIEDYYGEIIKPTWKHR